MRIRRFANTERIRSKERRLHQVLRRYDMALLLSTFPKGVIGALSHTTAGTTSTIHTPLRVLVDTAQETWKVDFAPVPDPTGGFADVVIPAARQVGELASQVVLSFAGQAVGPYIVYAQHQLADENPEQRDPPGKYAGGTGVFAEHKSFYGYGHSEGTPIPRDDYDSTLTPEVVSEAVDRLTINFTAENSVPSNATPLIRVVWNGASISSAEVVARTIDLGTLFSHLGAGGNAHAVATTSLAGFMSATDKAKLDAATANATASTLAMRDASGRLKVASPSAGTDAANKAYVDALLPQGGAIMYAHFTIPSGTKTVGPSGFNFVSSSTFSGTRITQFDSGLGHNNFLVMPSIVVTPGPEGASTYSVSWYHSGSGHFNVVVSPTGNINGISLIVINYS